MTSATRHRIGRDDVVWAFGPEMTPVLEVAVDVYERTRAESALFFVVPGHEDTSVESVVDGGGDYVIVRKHPGEPQEIAAETDPRA